MAKLLGLQLLILSLLLLGCTKEIITIIEPPKEETIDRRVDFYLDVRNNAQSLLKTEAFTLFDTTGLLMLPYITQNRSFVVSFNAPEGTIVRLDTVVVVSGESRVDFSGPVHFQITFRDGVVANYTLSFHVFTGLPIFWINTDEVEISRQSFSYGSLRLDGNGSGVVYSDPIALEIRGRGNSTWEMPKKPYRIRFRQNTAILGLPSTRNWVLLANFADKTMLRNDVAFEMGRQLAFDFVPRSRFVELFMNGEYQGTYQLTDQIRVEASRVNIPTLRSSDTDSTIITGGYLLEVDQRMDEITCFRTKIFDLPICFKDPEVPNQEQFNYMVNYINSFEEALMSEQAEHPTQGIEKYVDINSFIDWYLINELTRNNDAVDFSSIFLHKDRNGLLKLGPIWDFDISLGNINYNGNYSPEGWWIRQGGWFSYILKHPNFQKKLSNRWKYWKENGLNQIFDFVNFRAKHLQFSQIQNFNKWQTLYNATWPNYVVLGTYENEVQYLKDWLDRRIKWMDTQID